MYICFYIYSLYVNFVYFLFLSTYYILISFYMYVNLYINISPSAKLVRPISPRLIRDADDFVPFVMCQTASRWQSETR